MRYGIPNFKLEKGLIDRRIEQMEAEGTRFRTNVEIGKDISWMSCAIVTMLWLWLLAPACLAI